jgi:hypothetical protein
LHLPPLAAGALFPQNVGQQGRYQDHGKHKDPVPVFHEASSTPTGYSTGAGLHTLLRRFKIEKRGACSFYG